MRVSLKSSKRRAKRAGAYNIETRVIESSKAYKKLYNKVDRVLIDAPCTGLGTIKRNPDLKWKLQPDFVSKVIERQAQLIDRYSKLLKKNGKIVYATCSILPQENEEQIQSFLNTEQGSNFKLEKQETISPVKSGYDGFYMALLSRKA